MRPTNNQSHPWLSTILAIAVVVALGCMGVLRLALASNNGAAPMPGSSLPSTAAGSRGAPGQQLPVQPPATPMPVTISGTPEGPCDYVVPAVLGPSAPPHPVIVNGTSVPVHVLTPTVSLTANPGEPAIYDQLRVVPIPYPHALHHTLTPCPPQPANSSVKGAIQTHDPAVVRTSPLYAEPKYVPQGYKLATVFGLGNSAETGVELQYQGPGRPFSISRGRMSYTPVDVYMRVDSGGPWIMTVQTVGGHPAFVEYPRSNSGSGLARVTFARNGIVTVVSSEGGNIQDLISVAASLP